MRSLFILVIILLSGGCFETQAQNPQKLNIIHILADDVGYDDLSCFGSKDIETPNLDRLAAEGAKYTNFYSPHGTCTPSRAALLTGRYAPRLNKGKGITVLFPHTHSGLEDELETTITELLKEKGYKTALYGKWHLGHLPQYLPCVHGFDEFLGIPYANDHGPERLGGSGWRRNGVSDPQIPLVEQAQIIKRCDNNDLGELPALFTREACKFIYRSVKEEKPFYLQYANIETHTPYYVPKGFEGMSKAGAYGDAVQYLDRSVGIIMETVRRLNIEKNTIIIFSSDNGPLIKRDLEMENCYGKAGFTDPNREHMLRGGKYQEKYEGGPRVSCIMKWPGMIPAGSVNNNVITAMDLFVTLANITACKVPEDRIIDGKDILPLIKCEENALSPHEAVYLFNPNRGLQSIRYKNWKFVLANKKRKVPMQLYDLSNDLGEITNVAEHHTKLINKLMKMAENANKSIKENRPIK